MDAWQALVDDVADLLAALPEDHFLVLLTGPLPPHRWFRRADPAAQPGFVQFRALDAVLMGECAARTPEQQRAVRALGWKPPDPRPYWLPDGVDHHWRQWPPQQAGQAAQLAVAGLRALGLDDPAAVVREQGH